MSFPTPREAFRRTGFAVQATIRKVEYLEPAREVPLFEGSWRLRSVPRRFRATLEVSAVWKGQVGRELVLHARQDGSDCVGFTDQPGVYWSTEDSPDHRELLRVLGKPKIRYSTTN